MNRQGKIILAGMLMIISSMACSVLNIGKQAHPVEQTALAVRTEVGGVIRTGNSLLQTAQALLNSEPGLLETARVITTQVAPFLSTVEAVDRDHPGLILTSRAVIEQEIPTGEPPADIPILSREQIIDFFGTSQYIFYTTSLEYTQVLKYYLTQMPVDGWQFLDNHSHEYAHAAELVYSKEGRVATLNLTANPLNQTSAVVIAIVNH